MGWTYPFTVGMIFLIIGLSDIYFSHTWEHLSRLFFKYSHSNSKCSRVPRGVTSSSGGESEETTLLLTSLSYLAAAARLTILVKPSFCILLLET